ncbi:MAG TPA: right-handed parallel beta-helix repeat-containing protein, partial [Gemmatimonadaceae bacterium]|nr:right-handed parallel beta-helix repeat-containing protein [Gemmatimonadaceae bacterium]
RSAVNWSSDDGSIATVSASGIVRARGVGTTIVRAVSPTAVDRRDSVFVVVTNAPVSIVLSAHVDSLTAVSMQRSYTAEVRNAAGALITSPLPTWRSTATAVATVNGLGTVTAIGAGSALIIAQAGAVADTLRLAVADRATQVTVTPKTLTVPSVGDTLRLTASVLNSAGRTVAGAVPAWHSTDPGVTQVLADGRVIGTGAGTARVVASYDPLADTVTVTVTNAPVSVDIGPTTLAFVALGDSTQPAFDARNSRGNLLPATSLIWTSDDPAIARVSAGAMISARDIGRTVVRATSPFNSALRDSVVVTVTNDPASVVLDGAAADTLTAGLQSLTYTATARNIRGALLPPSTVTWRSTNSPVAAVTAGGVVTSMGAWGSALVIAQAGDFADTVAIVVTNLTRLYVDNGVFAATRAGTGTRPFARIQDAVNAADAGDTVVVRPGVTGYSEAVSLGRRITLIGDSTAFVANGRDPLRLPRVSHDLGSGGIVANTPGSSFVIRYFAVQNTVDGAAVAVLGASNTILEYLYVNPGTQPFRSGSGIVVENVTGSAMVVRSTVQSVVGYGVRLRNVQNGRVESVTVRDVGTSFTDEGVGVQVLRGANNRVVGTTVRRTEGPQFAFDTTSNVVVSGNDLAGEQALLRVAATSGLVTIDGNAFDLRRQSGDPAPVGPSTGRAGLAVRAASGVTVSNNTFTDVAGSVSQIDPVRLSDARPTGGAAAAVTLSSNRFTGGRHAIHSERSTWLMTSSRFDNPGVAVYATESDSVTMIGDTVSTAGAGCVQLLGASSLLDVLHSAFVECSADGTAAVTATGAAAVVGVDSSAFVGANQRVVSAPQARFVSLRGNTLSGAGTLTLATAQRTVGAVDAAATDSIRFVANDVREYRVYAAASLRAATVRADSNFVSRNLAGLRLGSAVTALVRDNSFFDNDALATIQNRGALGLANDGTAAIAVGSNWWGDDRGPQRAANALAVGDSATGLGLPPATFAAQPIPTHQGVGAPAGIRMVRGDSQSVRKGTALPRKLTVRVVDAVGRPLAGTAANVQFTVVSGGGTLTGAATNGVLTVTPNASGLAEASFTTPGVNGICKVSATVGTQSVTFTVTSTP